MHLSGETITLGSFFPVHTTNFASTLTSSLYNAQQDLSYTHHHDFLPAFSISIDSMRSTPSPDEFPDDSVSDPSDAAPPAAARSKMTTSSSQQPDPQKSGHQKSTDVPSATAADARASSLSLSRASVLVQVDQQQQQSLSHVEEDSGESKLRRERVKSSNETLSLVLTNPEITEIDLTERDSSEEVTESPPLTCVPTGCLNLNEVNFSLISYNPLFMFHRSLHKEICSCMIA